MTLPVEEGTLIAGKYRIEKVLGEGGMGVVVAARHVDLDQRVAIKFLLPHALADEAVVARFAREARAAAKIQSPHVAKVMDVGRLEDGSPYMVMEYLEGEDLESRLQRERSLPITEAVSIMLQACEAMAEAHAAGIVHRDLKPANLFLARTPGRKSVVKVLDFGISKLTKDGGRAVTQTSSLLGTPYYMSPEQLASSKTVDARSDIWTIGVILYEIIGGGVPFIADTMPGVVAMILQNRPTPLRELRSDCPDELVAVIAKCMQSSPDMRYRDVAELATALAPFGDAASRGSVEAITRTIIGASMSPESIRKISSAPTINTNPGSERKPGTLDAAAVTSEVRGPKLDLVAEPSEVLPLVDPPEKKGGFPLAAVAAIALVVGGGIAWIAIRPGGAPTEAPSHDTIAATTTETSAPTTSVTPPPPSATMATVNPPPSASVAVTPTATAAVTTTTTHGGTPKPSASAAASASAPATVVATATAPATATATTPPKPSGNPLSNMGIK